MVMVKATIITGPGIALYFQEGLGFEIAGKFKFGNSETEMIIVPGIFLFDLAGKAIVLMSIKCRYCH